MFLCCFCSQPATAYALYVASHRPQVTADNPALNKHAVTKLLTSMWQQASPEQRQAADAAAEADRERYKKEMETYVPPEGDDADDADEVSCFTVAGSTMLASEA